MNCASCGAANDEGSDACKDCGAAFPRACPSCSAASPPGFKFCGQCGHPFAAGSSIPAAEDPEREAERRQLTVLFCDLVGSTELSERLDPEDLRDVLREYQTASVEAIERYDGHVAQYLGDGLLVYFGYPRAHEDDARRGVLAGLGIVEAIRRLAERVKRERGFELAVRVGVHTGPVVLGEMGAGATRERLALGQTPNVAARLQGLATPGAVVVSSDTHALAQGFFAWRSLGARDLKGVSRPMPVYEAIEESSVRSQFELAEARGLGRIAGRVEESQRLEAAMRRAMAGHGRVMAISGDAGIGKSRMVHELRARADGAGLGWLALRCSTYRSHSALHPVVESLGQLLDFDHHESPQARRRSLERGLEAVGLSPSDWMPLAATFLSVPLEEEYEPPSITAQQQRERAQEQLIELCLASARRRPLVLVLEDLHWIDPSTLELLGRLIERVVSAPVFLLLTHRKTFEHDWPEGLVETLELNRLGRDSAAEIVHAVTRGRSLPAEILAQILEKTDGVPLFVEELTKMILESGLLAETEEGFELQAPLPPLAIPATLQDSLMARLDRLGDAREFAQLGAIVGREFSYEMLAALGGRGEAHLQRSLARLVEAELVYQRGAPPTASYEFKHALIQDVAYASLLKSSKQRHHRAIASILIETFPDKARRNPEVVAHHYTEAGLGEQAIEHWLAAGRTAMGRSADIEAIEHLRRGLRLLEVLPRSPQRDGVELSFQLSLAAALTNIRGYTLPEVQAAYARALELCNRAGDTSELTWVLVGLSTYHLVLGELDEALALARRVIGIGEQADDSTVLASGLYHAGAALFFQGELHESLGCLVLAAEITPPDDHSYREHLGMDLRTVSLGLASLVTWLTGDSDLALQRGRQAIARARELGHAQTLAMALVFGGTELQQFRGDAKTALVLANELCALAGEQGFFIWQAQGGLFELWARARTGEQQSEPAATATVQVGPADIERMRGVIDSFYAAGSHLAVPYFLGLMAEVCICLEQVSQAGAVITEALALVEKTHDCFWEPELLRLQGELAFRAGDEAGAERSFRAALACSSRQGSLSLRLRAATSLGRLLKGQGRVEDLRAAVQGALSEFPGSQDAPDHRLARELLAAPGEGSDAGSGPRSPGAGPVAPDASP